MTDQPTQNSVSRVLSGMRPTGKLHLGNYVGALKNWVYLQSRHDCFFMIADWHALTTDYENTRHLADNTREVLLDWLAAGLDPAKCTMFVQSHVLQHSELHVLLSMITPLGELERVPSYKDQQQNLASKDLTSYGFLGYPLLQAADILVYRANWVPVGEDQVAHVELTRTIARRFNSFFPKGGVSATFAGPYGGDPRSLTDKVLIEPKELLTSTPKLLGTDGRKMSKSYGNSILLSEESDSLEHNIRNSKTDRPTLTQPGNPDRCPVGNLHQIFSDPETFPGRLDEITVGCTTATITCVQCKSLAIESVETKLRPIREKRRRFAEDPKFLLEVIRKGAQTAAKTAETTMKDVRSAIGLLPKASIKSLSHNAGDNFLLRVPASISRTHGDEQRWEIRSNLWLEKVQQYSLTKLKDKPRVFITRKNKKVGIYDAAESSSGEWVFGLKDQPLNVLVLLAQDRQRNLHDYVLPQAFLQEHWKQFERTDNTVEIHLRKIDDVASLLLKDQTLPIQQYEGDYSALQ
ncbi:MAG TPA: tryptophan--tRNA ligase [Candidatus Angelobacter sp.]